MRYGLVHGVNHQHSGESDAGEHDTLRQSCDFIVVLCDIYGGSPFNVTSRTLLSGKELIAFTGVNLPILIDLLFSGDLTPDEVRAHVAETASTSIQEVNKLIKQFDETRKMMRMLTSAKSGKMKLPSFKPSFRR